MVPFVRPLFDFVWRHVIFRAKNCSLFQPNRNKLNKDVFGFVRKPNICCSGDEPNKTEHKNSRAETNKNGAISDIRTQGPEALGIGPCSILCN